MENTATRFNRRFFTSLVEMEEAYGAQQENRVAKVLTLLAGVEPKGLVADLGCFTGAIARRYFQAGATRVEGFDIIPEALALAASRGIEGHMWRMGEEPAPVYDGRYDVVIAGEIIEHLLDTDSFIQEVHRMLRPGGHLILSTINLGFWGSRVSLLMGRSPWAMPGVSFSSRRDQRLALEHVRIGHLAEWRHFLTSNGFQVLSVDAAPPFPRHGAVNRLLRAADTLLTRSPSLGYWIIFLARKGDRGQEVRSP